MYKRQNPEHAEDELTQMAIHVMREIRSDREALRTNHYKSPVDHLHVTRVKLVRKEDHLIPRIHTVGFVHLIGRHRSLFHHHLVLDNTSTTMSTRRKTLALTTTSFMIKQKDPGMRNLARSSSRKRVLTLRSTFAS